MHDELLDIVDDNDRVINVKPRSTVYAEKLTHFRVINAFIKNSNGQLWSRRRSAHKRIFPLCLGMSVGGHVESGESYEQAFRRETLEELNINIDTVQWKHIGHMNPLQNRVSAFMQIYEISLEQTPDYNRDDFIEYFWFTPKELVESIARGEKVKGDLPKILAALYLS